MGQKTCLLAFVVYVYPPERKVFFMKVIEKRQRSWVYQYRLASDITASGRNMEVCELWYFSNSLLPVDKGQFSRLQIVRVFIDKRDPGRVLDTKNLTYLTWTNLIDVLRSYLRDIHDRPDYCLLGLKSCARASSFAGLAKYARTPSRNDCTAVFLMAEPRRT